MTKTAFVVTQVGGADSIERQRANEVYEHILKPIFEELGLAGYRADLDETPGSITERLISNLIQAELVIVDLTGMNPNVFYELGVAHSFGKRIVVIADSVEGIPFDNKDQRTISLGKYPESGLPAGRAKEAIKKISASVTAALADDFEPTSPVKGAAGIASLDQLAAEDPVASELSEIREELGRLGHLVTGALPRSSRRESRDGFARRVAEAIASRPQALIDPDDFLEAGVSESDLLWLGEIRKLQIAGRARRSAQRTSDREATPDPSRRARETGKRFVDRELTRRRSIDFPSDNEGFRP